MPKIFWLAIMALCCMLTGCKKDNANEDQLPPATQIGAGTFGCKINGKVYVPKGSSGNGRPNPNIQYDVDLDGKQYLFIQAKKYENEEIIAGVDLTFRNIKTTGLYTNAENLKFSVGWPRLIGNCGMTTLDSNVAYYGGYSITKLDLTNRIVSGEFDFKAIRISCDTLRITDGRFDIKF